MQSSETTTLEQATAAWSIDGLTMWVVRKLPTMIFGVTEQALLNNVIEIHSQT